MNPPTEQEAKAFATKGDLYELHKLVTDGFKGFRVWADAHSAIDANQTKDLDTMKLTLATLSRWDLAKISVAVAGLITAFAGVVTLTGVAFAGAVPDLLKAKAGPPQVVTVYATYSTPPPPAPVASH